MNDFSEDNQSQSPTKTNAFCKGGCGCVLAFIAFLVFCLVVPGGQVHGDPIGFAIALFLLFLIGGCLGLLVRWIYKKGFDAGRKP
jgi:hypothetical protein